MLDFLFSRVKFLRELKEQIQILNNLNEVITEQIEEELRYNFLFMCPNCSHGMLVSKENPYDSICCHCGKKSLKELKDD